MTMQLVIEIQQKKNRKACLIPYTLSLRSGKG